METSTRELSHSLFGTFGNEKFMTFQDPTCMIKKKKITYDVHVQLQTLSCTPAHHLQADVVHLDWQL